MKSVIKTALTIGLILTLGADCYSQQRDVPGWESARWGMSEAELLKVFHSRLKKLPARMEFHAQYVDYVIPEFKLEGEPFTVFFQMDKNTNKLTQVLVRLNEQVSRLPREEIFNSLATFLIREYGEPGNKRDDRYSISDKYKGIDLNRTWKFRTTTVELAYGWDDQIYASLLTIRYFPTK